eukprot:5531293-Pleurochrysis_carterae.AAC.1
MSSDSAAVPFRRPMVKIPGSTPSLIATSFEACKKWVLPGVAVCTCISIPPSSDGLLLATARPS